MVLVTTPRVAVEAVFWPTGQFSVISAHAGRASFTFRCQSLATEGRKRVGPHRSGRRGVRRGSLVTDLREARAAMGRS